MFTLTIDPTLGRCFKLIRSLDHASGTERLYEYITDTFCISVSDTEYDPFGERPRQFVTTVNIWTLDERLGPAWTKPYQITMALVTHQEISAEEMQQFIEKISERNNS
jgi:hypothetical protein